MPEAQDHFARRPPQVDINYQRAAQLRSALAASRLEGQVLEGALAEETLSETSVARAFAATTAAEEQEAATIRTLRSRLAALEGHEDSAAMLISSVGACPHTAQVIQQAVNELQNLYAKVESRYVELESARPPPELAQQLRGSHTRFTSLRSESRMLSGELADVARREESSEDGELRFLAAAKAGEWTLRSLRAELAATERRGTELSSSLAVERERIRLGHVGNVHAANSARR